MSSKIDEMVMEHHFAAAGVMTVEMRELQITMAARME
jgi:hypothetical protein